MLRDAAEAGVPRDDILRRYRALGEWLLDFQVESLTPEPISRPEWVRVRDLYSSCDVVSRPTLARSVAELRDPTPSHGASARAKAQPRRDLVAVP